MRVIISIGLFCCLFLHGYAHRVWIVSNTNPVTSSAGVGRANKGDLKYCIEKYTADDVITFAPELAGQVICFETGVKLKTNASLTIDASNLSSNVIFDGSFKAASPKRINILIDGSQGYGTNYFIIRGVTFQNICVNDYISANMGALYINHGTVVVENCEFRDNIFYVNNITTGSSIQGAIICPVAGRTSLTVRKCKFINNFGRRGSAVSIWPFKETLIDACYFEGNNTYAGGACVFVNSSATETGNNSCVEIRNCTMTGNKGNAVGTLVSNLSLSNNAYTRIIGCTMVGNISTTASSTQMAMVNVAGRRLELGGALFGNNLNQNGSLVSDIAMGSSSSATLPEDSLLLLGYNIFSELNNFGVNFSDAKLLSSPRNIVYKEWGSSPLTTSTPTSEGVLLPSNDIAIQNSYLCVIPRETIESWMFAPAYDQLLKRRVSTWASVGSYEINGEGSTSDLCTSFNLPHKGIILLDRGTSVQLAGFDEEYAEISLYSSSGQKVKSSFQSLLNPVRIAGLPSGTYVVRVKGYAFKFVK